MRMKKIFILSVLATWLCTLNFYAVDLGRFSTLAKVEAAETQEVEFTITNKEVQGSGRYANLVLTGNHEVYGNIAIYLNEYNGSYKTYDVYYATIGKLTLTGSATWSKQGQRGTD